MLVIVGVIEFLAVGMLTNLPHAQPMAPARDVGFGLFLAFVASQVVSGLFLMFGRHDAWPIALVLAICVTIGIASLDAHGFWPIVVVLMSVQALGIGLIVLAEAPFPSMARLLLDSAAPLVPITFGVALILGTPPLASRVPDVVGVIGSVTGTGDGAEVFTLESGTTVEFDRDEAERLDQGPPDEGLLLYGVHDDRLWYLTLRSWRSDADCFELEDTATDMDTHILFDIGLLLPKDRKFQSSDWPRDDRYEDLAQIGFTPFCLNAHGQVTDYLTLDNPRR